jgi:signal transduction histidine kinase/DNA-binding NarL/FixJ family response regulator
MLKAAETSLSAQFQEAEMLLNTGAFFMREFMAGDPSHEQINAYLYKLTQGYKSLPNTPSDFVGIYGYFKEKLLLGIEWEPPEDFNIEERPWYRDAKKTAGDIVFSAPYVDVRTNKITVSLSKALYGLAGQFYGVICIDVDMGALAEKVRAIQFAEGGYGMLIDRDFTIIAHPDDYYVGKRMGDISHDYGRFAGEMAAGADISSVQLKNRSGVRVIILVKRIANGWYIGMATPVSAYYRDVYIMAFALSFLGLAFACLLSWILIRLNMAKLQSDEENKSKSSFLARMSHEIRTPLNAILGLSEAELQNNLSGRTRVNLEKIYSSGSHLLGIVNDILDISKIESGNFEILPAEYEFVSVINDTVQLNIPRIGSKPIKFIFDADETIPSKLYGDEVRIKQILNNLLSNAFKYTDQGKVKLHIGWERTGDAARLCFAVEDTGRGIKQADLEKLFSDYTQLDTAVNRKIGGTGLGLSITRGLVEKMGGTVTVESEYGKGSIFRVILSQGILDEKPIGGEVVEKLRNFHFIEDRKRSRGNSLIRSWMPYGKILVVDDLQTNLDVMTGFLMPYGLKVDTVLSSREAVERIRAEEVRYDLVFMDHMMPEMDGIEAVRIIRNGIGSDYARNVPIAALTANAIAGNREMFLANGFNDFIAKPVDIKRLDAALNQWVRDVQSEETLKEAETRERERPESRTKDEPGSAADGLDGEGRWFLEHPVDGVDFAGALALYGNSGAALIPVLKSFAAHTPLLLEKMDVHIREDSLRDYAVEVHGLKGTCNAICAAPAALARELEFASKEGKGGYVKSRHGELRRQALELTERLKELLAEWEAGRPAAEKGRREEPDRELLVRLSAAVGRFNSNKIEDALEELERYRYERGGELIIWLREQAEIFDYEAMHKRLEEFLN